MDTILSLPIMGERDGRVSEYLSKRMDEHTDFQLFMTVEGHTTRARGNLGLGIITFSVTLSVTVRDDVKNKSRAHMT